MHQTSQVAFVSTVARGSYLHSERRHQTVAQRIISKSVNHVVVVDKSNEIKGIVTSWDLTRAIAEGKTEAV